MKHQSQIAAIGPRHERTPRWHSVHSSDFWRGRVVQIAAEMCTEVQAEPLPRMWFFTCRHRSSTGVPGVRTFQGICSTSSAPMDRRWNRGVLDGDRLLLRGKHVGMAAWTFRAALRCRFVVSCNCCSMCRFILDCGERIAHCGPCSRLWHDCHTRTACVSNRKRNDTRCARRDGHVYGYCDIPDGDGLGMLGAIRRAIVQGEAVKRNFFGLRPIRYALRP